MSVFRASNYISWMMLILLPASLPAADARSALLHSRGGVWVNGDEVADSITVFAGDSIETKPGFVANLDVDGSSVLIRPESIVKFAGEYLVLEHGSVAVGTSTLLSVHINCLRVDPVTAARTQYEVVDVSGRVEVAARRSDVRIRQSGGERKGSSEDDSGQSGVVHEGGQDTRQESTACGAVKLPRVAGDGLNTKWLEIGAGGGGAAVLCALLCKGRPSSSVSPSGP